MNHQDYLISDNAEGLGAELRGLKQKRKELKAQRTQDHPRRRTLKGDEEQQILQKTGGRCHICGGVIEGKPEMDHVLAHSGGGTHSVDNYLPAHSLCNKYRWNYLPEEFQLLMKIGIWCKTQIANETALGQKMGEGFVKYERRRLSRRKKPPKG